MARHGSEISVLGPQTRVIGRISGEGALRIEGTVRGDVAVNGPAEVAEGASIEGNVSAESLEIGGTLLGDVSSQGPVAIPAVRWCGASSGALKFQSSRGPGCRSG